MLEDKYINVRGINTRYWSMGEQGSPVLLVHGFGASVEIWQHNISGLSTAHRVFALDLVGFGRSHKPDIKYSPSTFMQHLDGFITALDLDRVNLVGLSMGGGISLMYTLAYPEKVDKLVLVDSAGLGKELILSMRLMSLPVIGELMTKPSRKMAYLFFKPAVLDSRILKGEFTETYYMLFSLVGAQQAMLKVLRSVCTIFGPRKDALHSTMFNLDKITAPTLIIWGKQDAILPVKHAYFARGRIPNAHLHIFEQCGHMPNVEKPEEFNRVVLEFLSQ
jgi:4,5:9,10-diseco-3-hydroxy-5,9,17-trioxoandrosta-1(10),2-diene-4-oate hydrolase